MKKVFKSTYLALLLALSFSCAEKQSVEKEVSKPVLESPSKTDMVKFTSAIRAVIQDSKGNYWLGSHQEGIGLYDGNSFEYFTTNDGLPDNQVRSILEDTHGNIWIETAKGICSYDGKKFTTYNVESRFAQNEWTKTDNDLWFSAGNKAGVYRYDGQQLNYLAFPVPEVINPDNVYYVTGMAAGENGMLWVSTYAGVFGYSDNQFTIIDDQTLGLEKATGKLHIRSIHEDSKGRLWIGNNGIGVLLKEDASTINFSQKHNLIHPASSGRGDKSPAGTLEHVFAITEDGDGNIWFGDRDTGAWKYDGQSMTNYTIDQKLKSPMIWDIYEDQNKNLLFAMADGGVYQFKGESFDKIF